VIESSESLAPYSLKSEIDGVVIAKHITRGEPVSRETQAFIVADLSDVWIDISVYQKHLRLLRIGQPVVISAGHDLGQAQGELSYVSPVVDEETRTATARVVLPNPVGLWLPGMFVTARVEIGRDEAAVVVPTTALETIDDRTVIFVANGDGFESRPVALGHSNGNRVEVTSGLDPGEQYVSRGGFTLKAELARDELAGGHGH
jgi:membrane fusion protein, heavy metal efflux system